MKTQSNIRLATCALAALLSFGQGVSLYAQESHDAWNFRSLESADLLFHGLAVVGFQGFSSVNHPLKRWSGNWILIYVNSAKNVRLIVCSPNQR